MGDANPADPTVLPDFGQDQPDPVRFPNTRLRNSRSASISTWTTTSGGHSHTHSQPNNNLREPEQCRICRGEATPDDPLYHPCKCSGSIKWVHQECLMQWLAQTQRKHCELCKTPFRFTKLYDPDMPRTVPAHIFVGHMFKYSVRKLLVWARAALVVSVWLGWLPYFMRSVWAMLFWLCEEGWGGPALFQRAHNTSSSTGFSVTAYSTTVCPSSPLFVANTSPASVGDVLGRLPLNSTQFVNSLAGANPGGGYSFLSVLLRIIFGSGGVHQPVPPLKEIPSHLTNNVTATLFINQAASSYSNVSYPPSLLSEVDFLKNLTRNPTVNNNIIAVLEGQIITVLVVVCFILIILVRDYVVQQQPEINERAAFANLQNVQPQVAQVNVPDPALNDGLHGAVLEDEDAGTDDEDAWLAQPPQPRRRPDRNQVHNPHAADLERELGETDTSTIDEYLGIYREAGGNPDRIVELAQERGLEERLAYWIALTKTMKERAAQAQASYNDGSNPPAAESSTTAARRLSGHNLEMDSTPAGPRPDPFDDWRYPLEEDDPPAEEPGESSRDKGKGVATDDIDTKSDPEMIASSSRPRANTDGPEIRMHTNPLGSNSWSFNDLPQDDPNGSSTEEKRTHAVTTPPDINNDNYSSNTEVEPLLASMASQGESESFQENHSQDGDRDADDLGQRPTAEPWAAIPIPERQPESQELAAIPWPTLDETTTDSPAQPAQPRGLVPIMTDFMWQGVEVDQAQQDAIDIIADVLMRREDEANVGARDGAELDDDDDDDDDDMDQDDDAAAAIGLEQDAIDDAEDLEGVLELLGMRGPLAGLFQNAIFCVLLVSATIFLGLFVPYNIGRYALWFIAKPMRPVWILYSLCRFIQDMVVIAFGLLSHTLSLVHPSLGLGGVARLATKLLFGSRHAAAILDPHVEMTNAAKRVGHTVINELGRMSMSEIHTFSAVSHEALLSVKGQIFSGFAALGSALVFIFGGGYSTKLPMVFSAAGKATAFVLGALKTLPATLLKPNLVINVNFPDASHTIDPALAFWNGTDRFWAILAGYLTIYIAALLYLRRGGPISSSQTGQEWEAALIDALNQASGVMKVILIIGIEMLVFPLYCGMLLDIALLPLFENATLMSRLQFTLNFPITSIFVHWFVGTAYMFHFALFVSMCRKIMRRGVLYFIRDPDDPEFHPVRDVLERNVTTQLRKIAFSALVYGALVIICLGAVVWGLALSLPSVLPIHYSSNEPVLEFPLDLLFYNFLMPLAVKFFKPGDGLHAMYTWWFRTCGRCLRITWFLFGGRKADEEGGLRMIETGPGAQPSWWQAMFLQLDESDGLVRPWKPMFVAGSTTPKAETSESEPESPNIRGYVPSEAEARDSEPRESPPEAGLKEYLVSTQQLVPDGRFVRAPASDQVKIPKGKTVFLEVSEMNERLDGKPDLPETDLYSTPQYRMVYVPPHFRVRIFLFILLIWLFAAATGVGITIIPLVFGRCMFQLLIPEGVRTNDIYAFGIGIHVLGAMVYAVVNIRSLSQKAKIRVAGVIASVFNNGAVRRGLAVITRIAKIVYSYFFLLVVFPLMIASVAELYAMMPLHEFMYSVPIAQDIKQVTIEQAAALNPRHTIRVMQSWTIGLLYLKLSVRGISTWFSGSRLALATKAVLRRGWFNPNAGVLTRAFVIPAILLWTVAMAIPAILAKVMISWRLAETLTLRHPQAVVDGEVIDQTLYDAYVVLIYRRSFPLTALLVLALAVVWGLLGVFQSWKMRIRDEAYLIGERLQNYGGGMPQRGALGRGARGGWRAGIAVNGR
ncbi:hypothetical protein SMACR_08017 [Sordaria macrospora]|uniref:RING-type E3 ubiquitin transferase n=2 Tax=Sordaria macrospora TaxID=5147 RepID=F7VY70_SORMK|nr:uncharacterized protein SMAC_08017 [Sordaria macrospora k-hell]KAA8632601.1 hypothetical protein SMACR_08017 [Sordaria macrospora]WPJ62906.1 hypothetical protein SMAC4_08017 [Sordaria macrospora]CCC10464.1 unnamed protein product [Sordaria macrospora k-hell]